MKTELLSKIASELAAKFDYSPDALLELAAMLAEQANYHEVAKNIREA